MPVPRKRQGKDNTRASGEDMAAAFTNGQYREHEGPASLLPATSWAKRELAEMDSELSQQQVLASILPSALTAGVKSQEQPSVVAARGWQA